MSSEGPSPKRPRRRPWVSPELSLVGTLSEVIQSPGKNGSAFDGDPYAANKPGGSG